MGQPITVLPDHTYGPLVADFLSGAGHHRAFIGICIYRPMSNRSFLQDLIPWVRARSPDLKILVGDYLERHNLVAFEGLPVEQAASRVQKRGGKILRAVERILAHTPGSGHAPTTDFRSEMEHSEYASTYDKLLAYHDRNPLFAADVRREVERFVSDSKRYDVKVKRDVLRSNPEALDLYVLEEVAMYIHMYLTGYTIEVYPGQDLSILRKIAERTYTRFPFDYSQRTHIGVKRG